MSNPDPRHRGPPNSPFEPPPGYAPQPEKAKRSLSTKVLIGCALVMAAIVGTILLLIGVCMVSYRMQRADINESAGGELA